MILCQNFWNFYVVFTLLLPPLLFAKDYYELLGISRDANDRDIRKAFKKLALHLHPDKNTDDPEANDKFIKVVQAYEVLKDEEKRKKYDMFGEDGLKDDFKFAKSSYKSWNYYYENFGIYDDDPEIITLNKADFDQSVTGTADMWFINYYSPSCSHCHELAPAWREMARDLESVIRIGAVNCEEEWILCRQQGIQSYPSLMIYPKGEKYRGERTTRHLVKFILQQLNTRVIDLWEGNFYKYLTDDGVPWLIVFCKDDGDCPSTETIQKVAAMLDGLVNVGTVDCSEQTNLCSKLGHFSGIRYFTSFDKDHKAQEIETNDAKEITKAVLEFLPQMITLNEEEFQEKYRLLQESKGEPWLIEFTKEDQPEDLQLRKLPALLSGINVGRIDCAHAATACVTFFIRKHPMFILFKQNGGHEIHHGRLNAYDIASFARESILSNVQVLGPHDFPHRVINGDSTWFIDFYAPWCPPCMQLLPEWRKASRSLGHSISFGTVDCTIHQSLCNNYNIRSYPTSILYNQSHPHQYFGPASAPALVEFVQDVLSPPVTTLNIRSFEMSVTNRPRNELWVIDFYAPWCQPCQQLSSQWRKLAKMFSKQTNVNIAQIDCTVEAVLCDNQNVRSYPTIRLYPVNTVGTTHFYTFNDWNRDAVSLRSWIHQFLPSRVTALDPEKFENEVLGGKRPWAVDFYAPWCGHCQLFAPEFETVAEALHEKVSFGKLNCEDHHDACRKAGVRAYPTVKFYRGDGGDRSGETVDSQESQSIVDVLTKKVSSKTKQEDVHDEL